MPTNAKTKATRSAARKTASPKGKPSTARPQATSAIDLLEQDHREVEEYFEEFEELEDNAQKLELAQKICTALTVHTKIEEEIFYPAARQATKDNGLLNEATVEHAGAKNLIAEIQKMKPGEDLYDERSRCWASKSSTTSRRKSLSYSQSACPRRWTSMRWVPKWRSANQR